MGLVSLFFTAIVWILFILGCFTLLYEVTPHIINFFTKKKVPSTQAKQWDSERTNAAKRLEDQAIEKIKQNKREKQEKREKQKAEAEVQRQIRIAEELERANTLQKTKQEALERNLKRKKFVSQQRKSKREKKEDELAVKIKNRADLLHDEPSGEDVVKKKAVQLRLRLPNGEYLKRNFLVEEKLEQIFCFVEMKFPFLIENSYFLVSYPRAVHSDPEETLLSCGIKQSMSLTVELC
mmetsp:Transcript_114385/g.171048  ORF Transcript_114385/g.171048 Transcript_114385/m.171048 type:complete len:237 (+) Transcript_114385:31-741(+)